MATSFMPLPMHAPDDFSGNDSIIWPFEIVQYAAAQDKLERGDEVCAKDEANSPPAHPNSGSSM